MVDKNFRVSIEMCYSIKLYYIYKNTNVRKRTIGEMITDQVKFR